jgi:FAD/FMN-containing dehydrogenase
VFGQAQTTGVVLDLAGLATLDAWSANGVRAGAGATWESVVASGLGRGVTPPVLTDYLGLSVGGTLSLGGLGTTSFLHGAQTDRVTALEVVTGSSELVRCSKDQAPELFDACRAGLGQCGVIVAAELELVAAPARVTVHDLRYAGPEALLADQRRLADERSFDHLCGAIVAEAPGRYVFSLTAAIAEDAGAGRGSLAGLSCIAGAGGSRTQPYRDFTRRVEAYLGGLRQLGVADLPHPWVDLFVPASRAEAFLRAALGAFTSPRDGMILTYVLRRSRFGTPLLALPDDEHLVLFDLLRNAVPHTRTAALLESNRALWRACGAVGGCMYPVGAVPLATADWRRHFGRRWDALAAAKARFDPSGVLGAGPGIFA